MARLLTVAATTLFLLVVTTNARGQIPTQGYAPPAGATLPYQLEYFRPQQGLLDQYNQFVAPRANLQNQLANINQRQNTDFRAVENQIKESDRIRESRAAATGTSAGFMNYSHYFGGRSTPGAAAARTARRPLPQTGGTYGGGMMGGGLGLGGGT
jgi:hypothetical protein